MFDFTLNFTLLSDIQQ